MAAGTAGSPYQAEKSNSRTNRNRNKGGVCYENIAGLPAIREIGLASFLFGIRWASTASQPSFGILPFILTSIWGTAGGVLIAVRDTGIGIPKKDQKRIFERFYRVDKSRSTEIGGTGLGLSIVKHAVQIHSGRIELTSEVGQGTEIRVWLPERSEKEAEEEKEKMQRADQGGSV